VKDAKDDKEEKEDTDKVSSANPPVTEKKAAALVAVEPQDSSKPESLPPAPAEEPKSDAPSSFPASLRGGWQALLAKKRTETAAKPKKPDQATAIMELMQTPKTYTAWTPDSAASDAKSAAAAKSDLLAAEKAFDSDDDEKDEKADSKPPKTSLLQMDGGLGWAKLEEDVGGSDPLAFFQVSQKRSSPFALSGASEAAGLVLDAFAQHLHSDALLEFHRTEVSEETLQGFLDKAEVTVGDEDQEKHDLEAQKTCAAYEKKQAAAAKMAQDVKESQVEAEAQAKVLQHEIAARKRVAEAFGHGSQSLLKLQRELKAQEDSESKALDQLKAEANKLSPVASNAHRAVASLQDALARLDGFGARGLSELEDAIAAAAARRSASESASERELKELESQLGALQEKAKEKENEKEGIEIAEEGLEEMCRWTAGAIKAREEKRRNLRLAASTALAVLREELGTS